MIKIENFEIESLKIEFGLKDEMTLKDLSSEEKDEFFNINRKKVENVKL